MRAILSQLLLAATTLAAFFAAFTPSMLNLKWLIGLGVAVIVAALLSPLFPRKLPRLPVIILAVLAVIVWPFCVIIALYGEFDVAAFIAHYVTGITGFGLSDVIMPVVHVGVCLGIFGLGVTSLASRLNWLWLVRVAYIPLLIINPIPMEVVKGALAPTLGFPVADMLADPTPLPDIGQNPDILLLFLEGTERTFAQMPAYAEAYKPILELANEGTSLTNVQQLYGTGWTMAGVVATTCGLNHAIPRSEWKVPRTKTQSEFGNFACLTDFLAARHYDMATLIGADITFAGHQQFFERHGVAQNHGRDDIRKMLGDTVYADHQFGWGVDDWAITEAAKQVYEGLGQDGRPRFLMTATLGPHGAEGYISAGCKGNPTAEMTTDMAAAIACSAPEAIKLIRAAQAMKRPNGLRIIVMSDHLNHSPAMDTEIDHAARRNTVMLLGKEKGLTVDRPGTMVDVYPTLLDWLDLAQKPVAAGLGKSLLSDQPNLTDLASMDTYDRALPYDPTLWEAIMTKASKAKVLP